MMHLKILLFYSKSVIYIGYTLHNAPVIVTTAPDPHTHTQREGWGIAWLKYGAVTFGLSLQCRGNEGVLTLGFLPKRSRAGQSFDLQFVPREWGL